MRPACCVYCGASADSKDHAPPRCFLRPPLPSNLITLDACTKCNNERSTHESVVRNFLTMVSSHPDLVAERNPGCRWDRAMARDRKLKALLEGTRGKDGNYFLTDDLRESFRIVLFKTAQGLFRGLFEQIIPESSIRYLLIQDLRTVSVESVLESIRPSMVEISNETVSEISPNSWHTQRPLTFMKLAPISGGPEKILVFRQVRQPPVDWFTFQEGIFSAALVEDKNEEAVLVCRLWDTVIASLGVPWPGGRGPLRRGKNNPFSRDDPR
jgi:hypothetical protein